MKRECKYYELSPSQEVVKMQLLFSTDKRVINILSSATCEDAVDAELMRQAITVAFMRNDSMHIKFVKKRKLMQYFDDEAVCPPIPYLQFGTKEEQEKFVDDRKKKAIEYKRGKVVEFYMCKTYAGKFMVFIKICHLIADLYGLNVFYKDLFDIYDALKSGTPLPPPLPKYEEVLKKDLLCKHNESNQRKCYDFFNGYMKEREEPFYAGVHGVHSKIAKANFNKRSMKMFFINNRTQSYMKLMDKETSSKIVEYCVEHKITPANFLFYAVSLTQSKLNNDVRNLLQLELSNCRATALERCVGGTKTQSLGCYVTLDPQAKLSESLDSFCKNQMTFYRYLGFSDFDFQMLTHRIWKSSNLRTYYALTFSFVPFSKPQGVSIQIYSNGKCALPCYYAVLFDVDTHEMQFVYDVQKKLTQREDIDRFHCAFEKTVAIMLGDTDPYLKEINLKE